MNACIGRKVARQLFKAELLRQRRREVVSDLGAVADPKDLVAPAPRSQVEVDKGRGRVDRHEADLAHGCGHWVLARVDRMRGWSVKKEEEGGAEKGWKEEDTHSAA